MDTEHTTIDNEQLSNLIVAAELSGIALIVRVPDNNSSQIRKIIEIGAEGVIVPHVNNSEDAVKAVQAAKFPPEGKRGFGTMVRSSGFGLPKMDLPEHIRRSNEGVVVIPLIEEPGAVENVEAIADVIRVDMLLMGPADLSISMGLHGQYGNPAVRGCLEEVLRVGKKRNLPVMCEIGCLASPMTVEKVKEVVDMGLRVITFGSVEGAARSACLGNMEHIVGRIR